jgi:hypothetical protein
MSRSNVFKVIFDQQSILKQLKSDFKLSKLSSQYGFLSTTGIFYRIVSFFDHQICPFEHHSNDNLFLIQTVLVLIVQPQKKYYLKVNVNYLNPLLDTKDRICCNRHRQQLSVSIPIQNAEPIESIRIQLAVESAYRYKVPILFLFFILALFSYFYFLLCFVQRRKRCAKMEWQNSNSFIYWIPEEVLKDIFLLLKKKIK